LPTFGPKIAMLPIVYRSGRQTVMLKLQLVALSILLLTLVSATGCTNAGGADDAGARFESLGAEVERNDDGQVVAIRTHITDPPDRKGTRATDADLAAVAHLTSLRELRLVGTRVRGTGLANLKGLDQLETLDLTETQITDTALAHLQRLPNLRELRLQNCLALTNDGLQHLQGLANLRVLVLSLNQSISDSGVEHLSALPKLEKLVLVGCSVTDEGLRHLSRIMPLTALNLRHTYVTDEGLKHLKELPALEELYLQPTVFITDEHGFTVPAPGETMPAERRALITDAGLLHLRDCNQLARLDIRGIHSVTEAGISALKRARTNKALTSRGTSRCSRPRFKKPGRCVGPLLGNAIPVRRQLRGLQ
jgi:internalin A